MKLHEPMGFSPRAATLPVVSFRRHTGPSVLLVSVLMHGCADDPASPFIPEDAAVDSADPTDAHDAAPPDADDPDADPTLGKPCLDDPQCDDDIDCTLDKCDQAALRCRNTPNDSACQDERFCDGLEVCDPLLGCVEGEPITCSDPNSCTIDRCQEDTKTCAHDPRDADGDGDPDWHCSGGSDCDDLNPLINSLSIEICVNGKDDDCDGTIDEQDCGYPEHDTCSDPILVTSGQPAVLSTAGAKPDYAASCIPSGAAMRDIVAAIEVPDDGTAYDLEVLAQGASGSMYAAVGAQCGDVASELACAATSWSNAGSFARLVARDVPTGPLPIYLASEAEQEVSLWATLRAHEPPPSNETCGTALPLTPGQTISAELIWVDADLGTSCPGTVGELVYSFTTTEPRDMLLTAGSVDGLGEPTISLRDAECAEPSDELTCKSGPAPTVFQRALPAGTYFVAVGASAPTIAQLTLRLEPPTDAPPDETCLGAPALEPGVTTVVSLEAHTDDLTWTCLPGAVDAVYSLNVAYLSDVLLLGSISQGDQGSVSLWDATCAPAGMKACAYGSFSPVRSVAYGVPPGDYRAVIESRNGNPTRLTALMRPAQPATVVTFADTCDEALLIPALGGTFQGNTSNASAQYGAGCDQAGGSASGAPEQMLRLELVAPKRVIFDMRGSVHRTLLNIRKGPGCPGSEIVGACSVGYYDQRSFLDLQLDAGMYYVQVDGYFGESGAWFLDVFVTDP